MPFQLLYSALLTQTPTAIIPNIGSDSRNTIEGTWQKVNTGSFYFLSSGSFTGLSGSYTGSIGAYLTYSPSSLNDLNDTGSIIFSISSSSTASLKTTFNPSTFTLSDSVIKGTCSINIGINYID
jgi:hypothetical protein